MFPTIQTLEIRARNAPRTLPGIGWINRRSHCFALRGKASDGLRKAMFLSFFFKKKVVITLVIWAFAVKATFPAIVYIATYTQQILLAKIKKLVLINTKSKFRQFVILSPFISPFFPFLLFYQKKSSMNIWQFFSNLCCDGSEAKKKKKKNLKLKKNLVFK